LGDDPRRQANRNADTFPVGDDSTAHAVNDLYNFEGEPYAVIIERNGVIMAIHRGSHSPAQFLELGRKLVSS